MANFIEVLMVEDDPGDIELTRESLDLSKLRISLNVVEDGEEALAYLHHETPYEDVPRPDLVLLDLNLPKRDGREVLQEMKKHDELKRIPVVILTTSGAQEDILRTYDLGASSYVTKPIGLEAFTEMVKAIENFWFTIVQYPPEA